MLRVSGLVITVLLVALIVAFRAQSMQRADQLLAGEAQARRTLSALVRASHLELQSGDPHPGLAAIRHAAPALRMLPELADSRTDYARDGDYLYGLARSSVNDEAGVARHGYVLRAWPLEFGVTGDIEFHVREDGNLWEGQNQVGRSGTERGFPPPFPEPGLVDEGARWWRRRLADEPP